MSKGIDLSIYFQTAKGAMDWGIRFLESVRDAAGTLFWEMRMGGRGQQRGGQK